MLFSFCSLRTSAWLTIYSQALPPYALASAGYAVSAAGGSRHGGGSIYGHAVAPSVASEWESRHDSVASD